MELWALVLILVTIVVSAVAVALFARSRCCEDRRACGTSLARLASGAGSDACVTPVVYPSISLEGESVFEDAFPWHAPYVLYKPYLSSAALTEDIKANFAAFEPVLTSSQWTVTRCYLLDTSSAEVQPYLQFGALTSLALQVTEPDSTQRLVLMSLPGTAVTTGTMVPLVLFTTTAATDPATYTGTWTWRSALRGDGGEGEVTVDWWMPSPRPACIVPALYVSLLADGDLAYDDAFPVNVPFVPYKPYLDATALTADLKSTFSFFRPMLETSQWTVARCYLLDTTSPEAQQYLKYGQMTSVVLQVAEPDSTRRLVLMSLPASVAARGGVLPLVLYTTGAAFDPATYAGTWTIRTSTRGDGPPGELQVAWGMQVF